MDRVEVFVGLGSNVGDRFGSLQQAVLTLRDHPDIQVKAASMVYETEAHVLAGADPQRDHLNAVIQLETTLGVSDLLAHLKRIEKDVGRAHDSEKWSPRVLDLDILLFGDHQIEIELESGLDLIVPHPRMALRRFVLKPLSDLVHNRVVPGADGATVSDLLERCPDTARISPHERHLEL